MGIAVVLSSSKAKTEICIWRQQHRGRLALQVCAHVEMAVFMSGLMAES